MGGMFVDPHELPAVQAVDAEYSAAWVGGVVLGGVEPFAVAMEHAVAVEMAILRRDQHLQELPVA